MDKFVLNLIHRPEMVPEYSATVTGQGKEEDIGDKALLTESLDIFKTQQRLAHENGLKVTIQMTHPEPGHCAAFRQLPKCVLGGGGGGSVRPGHGLDAG